MKTIIIRNVHQALPEALYQMACGHGMYTRETRNGPVLMADGPVTTCYLKPRERLVYWPDRDANPFFHFMESLWMLNGRNDVAWISLFNNSFGQFSDDGMTFHGAYGYRWTEHFKLKGEGTTATLDQLGTIVGVLKQNPHDRRCVLTMWDPFSDLGQEGKDFPCNTHAYFGINGDGALDMTVCCRSNDVVWGCYGANAVHFSMLLEYMAIRIGVPVGRYWQVSNNWHLYLDKHEAMMDALAPRAVMPPAARSCPYTRGEVEPYPLMGSNTCIWQDDLSMFMDEGDSAVGYRDPFFRKVALPMLRAWKTFKSSSDAEVCGDASKILLHDCHATDWAVAGIEWLARRAEWREHND